MSGDHIMSAPSRSEDKSERQTNLSQGRISLLMAQNVVI